MGRVAQLHPSPPSPSLLRRSTLVSPSAPVLFRSFAILSLTIHLFLQPFQTFRMHCPVTHLARYCLITLFNSLFTTAFSISLYQWPSSALTRLVSHPLGLHSPFFRFSRDWRPPCRISGISDSPPRYLRFARYGTDVLVSPGIDRSRP